MLHKAERLCAGRAACLQLPSCPGRPGAGKGTEFVTSARSPMRSHARLHHSGLSRRAPPHPLLPAPVAAPRQAALPGAADIGHVLPVPGTSTQQLLALPRVGPAAPFRMAIAARGSQQLIPTQEG